jgi:hypothetical protein
MLTATLQRARECRTKIASSLEFGYYDRRQNTMRRLTVIAFSIVAAAFLWNSSTGFTAEPEVTFTHDIAPILYTKCVTCHRAGEVAPMPLLSYEEARPWARAIKEKVLLRQMPPWFADAKYGNFANDPSLTTSEMDTIVKWVDGGAVKGDMKDMPKPPQFTEGWQLGEPDLIVELPEVQIPATGPDYFPTPSIALNLTEDRWIRAVEIRPGNREVTHHTAIFSTSSGATLGGTGFFDVLAVWAVGTPPIVYPEGMGRWVRKGQTLRTNLHYHPNGKPQVDHTRVGLYFGKGEIRKEVVASLAGTLNFAIPPQVVNYEMRSAYVVEQDINIVSFFPHMHLRGKDMKMTATYPGGRQETLLNVPAYNFDWQLFYYPKTQLTLPKGTRIDLVAHYDNSASNKRNPDPTKTVTFGEASTSEMMFGMFEFTAVEGVSPKPGNIRSRMESLLASFPPNSAYLINVTQPAQTIPTVLYLPRSGDAAWYFPTLGIVNVSSINDLKWNGSEFQFSTMIRLGTGPGPFQASGNVMEDGSIHGSLQTLSPTSRVPFSDFSSVH